MSPQERRPVVVVGLASPRCVGAVVARLCAGGRPPACVLLGSRSARLLRRLARGGSNGLPRALRPRASWGEPDAPLEQLAELHTFDLRSFPVEGAGTLVVELARRPGALSLLVGCDEADPVIVESSGAGCVHGRIVPIGDAGVGGVAAGGGRRGADEVEVSAVLVTAPEAAGEPLLARRLARQPDEPRRVFAGRVERQAALMLADAVVDVHDRRVLRGRGSVACTLLSFLQSAELWLAEKVVTIDGVLPDLVSLCVV